MDFVSANSADPDEMPHEAAFHHETAFHLGLQCLSMYPLMRFLVLRGLIWKRLCILSQSDHGILILIKHTDVKFERYITKPD